MFDVLSSKVENALSKLRGRSKLSEQQIDEALREIRVALLEADVHVQTVKSLCDKVRSKALGKEIQKSLSPGEEVVRAVFEELVAVMGTTETVNLRAAPPVVLLVVGLQGSGKTTSVVKLARYFKEELRKSPGVVSADVYRPAAIDQLKILAEQNGIEWLPSATSEKPVDIAVKALSSARNSGLDVLIVDTAGRLQIDAALMNELADIVEAVEPQEILLVADGMTGQEAVNVARGFDERLDIDGVILTKLDGDARGGAALSIRSAIGKPIKFVGVGEKAEALEVFHPDRIASRILGMGDVLSLIEKATKKVSLEDAQKLTKKLKKSEFSLDDFLSQMKTIQTMGPLSSLMKMLPGMNSIAGQLPENQMDQEFKRIEAIILSMTKAERHDHTLIDGSRRRRIAQGSGTTVEEVNRLLKQFADMSKAMKKIMKMGPAGLRGLSGMIRGLRPSV